METLVLERANRLFFTDRARVVQAKDEISVDLASSVPDWDMERANPYIKWVTGAFVEADVPNDNTQFWTREDLELAEYTIKYSPVDMVHDVRNPIGFFASTRQVTFSRDDADDDAEDGMKIEALSGMWAHRFPFEAALIDQADGAGLLFYSMECIGSHVICSGDQGCGKKYEYMAPETHCEHLKERASIRHIVNPIFRGGAYIVPPVKPGWREASAEVYQKAVMEAASEYAEVTESAYRSLRADGSEITSEGWESLMASIVSLAE